MDAKKYPLIGTKPGGTSPAIAGSRIRVALIAEICKDIGEGPHTLGEIVEMYPHLTPDEVQAAIDYWHDHEVEIEAEIRADEDAFKELQAAQRGKLPRLHSQR
jgi:uncharacterized protein (DUF433 family)